MERIPVSSSTIASIGFDEDSSTLEIEFLSGSVYQYFDVPFNIYNGLIDSDSKGQYMNQFIKGHYRFVKV
jgi:hypothetical protein